MGDDLHAEIADLRGEVHALRSLLGDVRLDQPDTSCRERQVTSVGTPPCELADPQVDRDVHGSRHFGVARPLLSSRPVHRGREQIHLTHQKGRLSWHPEGLDEPVPCQTTTFKDDVDPHQHLDEHLDIQLQPVHIRPPQSFMVSLNRSNSEPEFAPRSSRPPSSSPLSRRAHGEKQEAQQRPETSPRLSAAKSAGTWSPSACGSVDFRQFEESLHHVEGSQDFPHGALRRVVRSGRPTRGASARSRGPADSPIRSPRARSSSPRDPSQSPSFSCGHQAWAPPSRSRSVDLMDEMWCEELKNFPEHPDWLLVKEKPGLYRMGATGGKKIVCCISQGGLQVRVGGGWMKAQEYLERYGPVGMARPLRHR